MILMRVVQALLGYTVHSRSILTGYVNSCHVEIINGLHVGLSCCAMLRTLHVDGSVIL